MKKKIVIISSVLILILAIAIIYLNQYIVADSLEDIFNSCTVTGKHFYARTCIKEATCTTGAEYIYQCSCGARSDNLVEVGQSLGHALRTRSSNENSDLYRKWN